MNRGRRSGSNFLGHGYCLSFLRVLEEALVMGNVCIARLCAMSSHANDIGLDIGVTPMRNLKFNKGHGSSLSQSSTVKPLIRPNSLVLWVINVTSLAMAIAAISKSFGPMGLPILSKSALIRP